MPVSINRQQKVAQGLSIGADIGDLEWPWTAYLLYLTEFDRFVGRLRHNVYCMQNFVFHFWSKLTHPAVSLR